MSRIDHCPIQCGSEKNNKILQIRDHCILLDDLFDRVLTNSREKSLAMTKLEEARMWAIKAISHNDVEQELQAYTDAK